MKVILHQDIRGIGKKNDVKDISDGYARNFLFPKKLAEPATPQALKNLEIAKEKSRHKEEEALKRLRNIAELMKSRKLEFKLKAEEDGSTFGSVTKEMIQKGIRDKFTSEDRIEVLLDHPIKKIGEHEVLVDLKKGIEARLKVVVLPE